MCVHTHVYKHDGRGMREGEVQTQQESDEEGREEGEGPGKNGGKGVGLHFVIIIFKENWPIMLYFEPSL